MLFDYSDDHPPLRYTTLKFPHILYPEVLNGTVFPREDRFLCFPSGLVPCSMTVILRGLREIKSMDILTRTLPLVFYRGGRCFGTPRGKYGVRGSFRS